MKRSTKKGFTIVELVIVIAVIAILTAVLIPTFTSVTQKAKQSSALQSATNEFKIYIAEKAEKLTGKDTFYIHVANNDNNGAGWWFKVEDSAVVSEPISEPTHATTDLTEERAIKSFTTPADLTGYTAPTTYNSGKYYTNKALTEGETTTVVASTTYYYTSTDYLMADQNTSVAIYAAN